MQLDFHKQIFIDILCIKIILKYGMRIIGFSKFQHFILIINILYR